jgi:hypothetical protein
MTPNTSYIILWVYIVLLLADRLMGLIKAKSKISLISSGLFAVLLLRRCGLSPERFNIVDETAR